MAIQDDAKNFLLSALSRAGGDLPSLQMEWLATQGYSTGTIDDRWQAYLSANAYYLPEGLSRLLVGLNRAIGNNWTPNLLFQSGDILLWYDPSDLTTMFTDTAGTQPVTADGDSVALMLDKGGLYDGRGVVNRTTYSRQFDNAAWAKTSVTVSANDTTNFDGTSTADKITESSTSNAIVRVNGTYATTVDNEYTSSFILKKSNIQWCCLIVGVSGLASGVAVWFDLNSLAVGSNTAYGSGWSSAFVSAAITDAGNGYARVSVRFAAKAAASSYGICSATADASSTRVTSAVYWLGDSQFENGALSAQQTNGDTVGGPGYHRVQATGTSMPKYKTGPNPAAAENSPELVANGTFDTDTTGWTVSTGGGGTPPVLSVVSGRLRVTADAVSPGSFPRALFTVAGLTVGRSYRVNGNIWPNGISSKIDVAGLNLSPWGTADRAASLVFTAAATSVALEVVMNGTPAGGSIIEADNISVKEIPASAPYIHWLLYDGTDDGHATGTIPFGTVTSDGLARRNLLTEPDKFDHTTWTKTTASISANVTTAPDGTSTADKLVEDSTNAKHEVAYLPNMTSGVTYTFSMYLKSAERSHALLQIRDGGTGRYAIIVDLSNGTVTDTNTTNTPSGTSHSVEALDNGWYKASVSITAAATAGSAVAVQTSDSATGTWSLSNHSYLGNGTSGIYIWGAQLELGSTATSFQNIGTDEVAVCAGVTKSSDAQSAMAIELSTSASANNGAFALLAPSTNGANSYRAATRGTIEGVPAGTGIFAAAPDTAVLSKETKISGDIISLRRNGTLVEAQSTDLGTGNFGSYVLYFGRRAGTSLPFNGREYQTVIRSRLLSATELASLETYVAAKTGVIL